jgi:hypothetical protein
LTVPPQALVRAAEAWRTSITSPSSLTRLSDQANIHSKWWCPYYI